MGSGRGASRGPTASAEGSGPEWLDAVSEAYDAAVEADPGVDPFCTRSDWILSFHRAFAPQRRVRVARRGDSYVALAGEPYRGGYVWEPLETMWGFASPLVGADAAELMKNRKLADDATFLAGLKQQLGI